MVNPPTVAEVLEVEKLAMTQKEVKSVTSTVYLLFSKPDQDIMDVLGEAPTSTSTIGVPSATMKFDMAEQLFEKFTSGNPLDRADKVDPANRLPNKSANRHFERF